MTNNQLYIEAYALANKYLVENDKKRDQVFVFFSALLALYAGLVKDTFTSAARVGNALLAIDILMIIISALIVRTTIWHLWWHRIYLVSIKTISLLIINNPLPSKQAIATEWAKAKAAEMRQDKIRLEGVIFLAFLIISYFPVFVLVFHQTKDGPHLIMWLIISGCLFVWTVFFWIFQLKKGRLSKTQDSGAIWFLFAPDKTE